MPKIIEPIISFLSAEYVFRWIPNGGSAVLIRSVLVSIPIYTLAIGLRSVTAADPSMQFSYPQLLLEIHQTIPWIGAIFGGVYVALYSRFSSQWHYLSGLFNQLMQAFVEIPEDQYAKNTALITWQAAFVEDAHTLHLAGKKMFAPAVYVMITYQPIRDEIESNSTDGKSMLDTLDELMLKTLGKNPAENIIPKHIAPPKHVGGYGTKKAG